MQYRWFIVLSLNDGTVTCYFNLIFIENMNFEYILLYEKY